jgi:hypothetical protein
MNRQFITASLVRMRVDKAFIPADVVVGQGGEVWHAYDQATLLSVRVCMHNGTLPCSDNSFSRKGVISSNGQVKEMLGSVLGSSW